MRKRHNALVIDTETTMKNEKPFLAYNIGGALGDIYWPNSQPLEFDFYVQEIIFRSLIALLKLLQRHEIG